MLHFINAFATVCWMCCKLQCAAKAEQVALADLDIMRCILAIGSAAERDKQGVTAPCHQTLGIGGRITQHVQLLQTVQLHGGGLR